MKLRQIAGFVVGLVLVVTAAQAQDGVKPPQ